MEKVALLLPSLTEQGKDVAMLKLFGQTLLETTFHNIRNYFDKIFVVANNYTQQSSYSKLVQEDVMLDLSEKPNTITNFYTGLKAVQEGMDYVFVTRTAQPLINVKAIAKLYSHITDETEFSATVPQYTNGKIEPLHSIYKVAPSRRVAMDIIDDEQFSFDALLKSLKVDYVPVGKLMEIDPKLETFFTPKSQIDIETLTSRMKNVIYKNRIEKARRLLKAVVKVSDTTNSLYFRVPGSTEDHEVLLKKQTNTWSCDCKYFTMKGSFCSHILAAKMKFEGADS